MKRLLSISIGAHMLYFIIVIAIASVIVYGVGIAQGPQNYAVLMSRI